MSDRNLATVLIKFRDEAVTACMNVLEENKTGAHESILFRYNRAYDPRSYESGMGGGGFDGKAGLVSKKLGAVLDSFAPKYATNNDDLQEAAYVMRKVILDKLFKKAEKDLGYRYDTGNYQRNFWIRLTPPALKDSTP